MEPRLELKEVQVTPTAPHSIVDRLMHGTTRRTGHALAGVLDFEVDPPLGGVELDLGDVPRRLQTQCGREEGFDRRTHGGRSHGQDRGVAPPITLFVVESISTGKGIEPLTWQGHELLDTIRSKAVWERIKTTAKEKSIELTFDSVKALGKLALEWVLAN
jgi:Hypothetical protein (DUF2513).